MKVDRVRSRSALVALFVLVLPTAAHADRRDLYLLVHAAPALLNLSEPIGSTASVRRPGLSLALTTQYGITNEWHIGASLRLVATRNAPFENLQLAMPDGSRPPGTLYTDLTSGGLAGVVAYRLDTGDALAPVARLELGGQYARHHNLAYYPTGTQTIVALADAPELIWGGGAHLGLEYRFWDHFVVGAAVGVLVTLSARMPWAFEVPITVGYIW